MEDVLIYEQAYIDRAERAEAKLADIENAMKGAMDETCGAEKHCSCVPLLRAKLTELQDKIEMQELVQNRLRKSHIQDYSTALAEIILLKKQLEEMT